MAFVLSRAASYSWPVKIQTPVDGGRYHTQTFDIEFKRVSQSRIKEIRKGITEETITADDELCKELVVGWSGIQDGGVDVPFSEAALDQILDIQGVAGAIVFAFFDSIEGSKRKN